LKSAILFRLIIFNFIVVTLISCAPSRTVDEVEILSVDRLINKLEANRRRIKNFEGNGTLIVNTPTLENTANFRVVLIKPDSIFLNILGPFGIELGQALATKKDFIFYDALSNTAYTGEIDDEVIQNIFRIDLPFSEIVDALTGSVNLTYHLYKSPDDFKVVGNKYYLTYSEPSKGYTTNYQIDVRRLGITDYELISEDNTTEIKGTFSNFEIIENVPIPFNIVIENKTTKQKLEINYKKININKKGLYIEFTLPDDAEIVKW
jgi:hypothetical protein